MSFYGILALAALTLHLLWIGWVLLGWLVTRNRPWLRGFHLASLVYAILIETLGFPCPLTFAEQFFRRRAGLASYEGSFLLHTLDSLIYPDVPPALLTGVAVALCAALLALYALRFRRRRQAGW